nr:unnamed protein product [Callosobruchus analis]
MGVEVESFVQYKTTFSANWIDSPAIPGRVSSRVNGSAIASQDPAIPTVALLQRGGAFSCLQSAIDSMDDPANFLEGPDFESSGLVYGQLPVVDPFLEKVNISDLVESCSSYVFSINARVPQGSVLSPTLFLFYINELLEITTNPICSFTDDSTLISCMEPSKPLPS